MAQEIGDIMGTTAGAMERKTAFVACKGTCDVTKNQGNYIGVQDCRAAVLSGMNLTDCTYGCLGLGRRNQERCREPDTGRYRSIRTVY